MPVCHNGCLYAGVRLLAASQCVVHLARSPPPHRLHCNAAAPCTGAVIIGRGLGLDVDSC